MIDVKIGEPYTKLQFKQGGRLGPAPVWSCAAAAVIAESAAWAEEEETRTRVLLIPHSQTQTQLIFKCWKKVSAHFMWHLVGIMNKCNTTAL